MREVRQEKNYPSAGFKREKEENLDTAGFLVIPMFRDWTAKMC